MRNLKLGISALVVAGATTALVVQHQAQTKLREENESLQQQITQLQSENGRLSNLVAQADSLQSLADDQRNELLKLRSDSQELAQWKAATTQKANDPMAVAAQALLEKINLLKERLRQMPDKNIPELQYLPDRTWANVAMNAKLETDEGVREALCQLRNTAKGEVAMSISFALEQYARANNGQLPTNVPQLQPYFAWFNVSPVPDLNPAAINAFLQRYQMLKTGNVSDLQPNDMVLAEKASVDDQYDIVYEIGLTGYRSHGVGDRSGETGTGTWAPWQQPDSK